jgi:hypothetical protein
MIAKNALLLKKLFEACVVMKQPAPGGTSGVVTDRSRLCGKPALMHEIARALASEVSEANGDKRRLPCPDILATCTPKSGFFGQWMLRALIDNGFSSVEFRWYSRGWRPGGASYIQPRSLRVRLGDHALICAIDLHDAKKMLDLAKLLKDNGANVIGVAAAFNSQDQTAEHLGVPHVISLFSRQDMLEITGQIAPAVA